MPAAQYLQTFGCRNVSCRLSCTCLRSNIYKHLAAGTCPADCPAAVLRMPALQYLQAFGCRNLSCCPAHACATISTSIKLQEPVLQTLLQLSCACLRYNIYEHLAAGTCPADCPALQYLQTFSCRNVSCRLSCSCPAHACATIFTRF